MKKAVFIFLSVFLWQGLMSQEIKGIVVSAETGKPMPFVNIRFDNTKSGTATDIDGRFIVRKNDVNILKFSFVGYRDTIIRIPENKKYIKVKLTPKVMVLDEVVIVPGINPAHRIIKAAIANRKTNNPKNLKSFSYSSYNKMIFTADPNPVFSDSSVNPDSMQKMVMDFLDKHHIFMMESATKRYYQNGKSYEKVVASRVSGFQDPFFVLIATQFQSFSFYEPFFNLLDKHYVNPISPGSTGKYFFLLKDTIYQEKDTVFIISFRPLKGKIFDGLKGVLYINTDGYAIQNVIAEPAEQNITTGVKIQQQYKKIGEKAWFPTQLNTTLTMNTVNINNMPMIGLGTTYIDSIVINEKIPKKVFRGKAAVEMMEDANKNAENVLKSYRNDTLTQKDVKTYSFIDSIGKANHFDRKLQSYSILIRGKIPFGKFSVPIDKFIRYNGYEKFRFGLGIETNERLSRYFNIGGYGAWATGDKQWKYGGFVNITPKLRSDFRIRMQYIYDLEESAATEAFSEISAFSSEVYREFLIDKMNRIEEYSAEIRFRAFKYFVWKAGYGYSSRSVNDDYGFMINANEFAGISIGDFMFSELRLGMRFAYGEKILKNRYTTVSLGTKYPVVYFKYSHGIKRLGSDFEYNRFDFQADKSFVIRYFGKSDFTLRAGYIDSPLPWYMLYNGHGGYMKFYIFSAKTFNTMRINEFLSDRYISIFWQHNFGQLFKNKLISPDFVIENNAGWGNLSEKYRHRNIDFDTMEKGYFESGILLDGILRSNISKVGFGVFYRYGPYSFSNVKQNFVYRMTIGWTF